MGYLPAFLALFGFRRVGGATRACRRPLGCLAGAAHLPGLVTFCAFDQEACCRRPDRHAFHGGICLNALMLALLLAAAARHGARSEAPLP